MPVKALASAPSAAIIPRLTLGPGRPLMRRSHVVALLSLIPAVAAAQTAGAKWAIDHQTSLAWWQVDPHYEHLWATTCPADSSWQAGEGRDAGLYVNYATRPTTHAAGISDPRIPLFPRNVVKPNCRSAMRGEITVEDTVRWRGVRGTVSVIADSLFTGLGFRDTFGRRRVLETGKYSQITFTIDSVVDVQPGDTLRAVAVGTFELHGVQRATRAPLVAWHEPAGFRVRAQFSVPALALTNEFKMSNVALGMGVIMRRWNTVHMGVDVVLRPTGS